MLDETLLYSKTKNFNSWFQTENSIIDTWASVMHDAIPNIYTDNQKPLSLYIVVGCTSDRSFQFMESLCMTVRNAFEQ